ncbi:DinB family protein [Alkalihalophilus marmarensis]|uniref:DinB family protein n=1 Tax=Alkalihalophilus marmarensis TaxID=521377 RepID=UPI002DBEF749|nr:DinB family protein [Alkalihalophilus marmarensis]MEC2072692.1 DinB family protein [Alkalihalophilus marmarensis]
MQSFFEYIWQVREEWLEWCRQISREEMLKPRTGGPGSILYTLFHVIEVEYSWIRAIQGKEDEVIPFEQYDTLEQLKKLSNDCRAEIMEFMEEGLFANKDERVNVSWENQPYTKDEILHHVIAHDIHHIGQLSVWARELELKPVTAHFIGRTEHGKS